MQPGTLCRGRFDLLWRKLIGSPRTMFLPVRLFLGTMLSQLQTIRFGHIRHIVHGLCQLGIEGLSAGLFPLRLESALQRQLHRLDGSGLKNLALSKGTDHALTMRALGLGMASLRQVFLDKPFGHGLSIGVVGIRIDAALDGFHFLHPDIGDHGQRLLSYGHQPGRGGNLNGIQRGSRGDRR